jgi:hypothetical protein
MLMFIVFAGCLLGTLTGALMQRFFYRLIRRMQIARAKQIEIDQMNAEMDLDAFMRDPSYRRNGYTYHGDSL